MKWLKSTNLLLFTSFVLALFFFIPNESFAANPYKIEINKRTNHLYLYKNNKVVKTYRVATGKEEALTPEGVFKIGPKVKYPQWRDSEKNKIIPGWKEDYPKKPQENPLGPRWMGLIVNGDSGNIYGIHGTNNPNSIGTHASKGCIRMQVKDIIELFDKVNIPSGTSVWIHSGTSNKVWMNGDSLKDVKKASGKIQITDRVNIRQGPSTVTNILGKAEKNAIYTVTGETKDWYRVKLNGDKAGFISKAYTKRVTETPKPTPKPDTEKPVQTTVTTSTSFTENGSLKIESKLPSVKKASGTWKISLNGKVIANQKNTLTTFTHVQKKPTLDEDQVEIKVEFTGEADSKKIIGTDIKTFTATKENLNLKPTFKENKLHIEASLKANQDAVGIWTIQLGKTKKVFIHSGKKLTAVFDSVTFSKTELPITVDFKGFNLKAFVTASYEKDLKVKIPNPENEKPSDNKEPEPKPEEDAEDESNDEQANDDTESEKPADNETDADHDQEEQTDDDTDTDQEENKQDNKADTDTEEESSDEIDPSKMAGDQTSNDDEQIAQKESTLNTQAVNQQIQKVQNTNTQNIQNPDQPKQEGGKLPKTASTYPLLLLLGLGLAIIGWFTLRKIRQD